VTSPFPSYTLHVPAKPKTLSRQKIANFYFVSEEDYDVEETRKKQKGNKVKAEKSKA
jgi:hypothetical protein